jgi:signal transduction histidine kinase
VAFQDRPTLTAIGTVKALGDLAVWIFYSERDGMQTLMASRLELDEARERNPDPDPDPAGDMGYAALQAAATGLRSTVTELHPQVLAQLGLTPGGARTVAAVRVPHRLSCARLQRSRARPALGMKNAGRATLVDITAGARTAVAGAAIFTRRPG